MVRGRNNPEIINGREFDEEGFDRTNASTWVEYKVDKKRLIKAYKGKGSFARFNLLVWKLIFYKAWFSATGATLFRPFARNATVTHRTKKGDWWERGRGTGGNNDIGLRGYTLLSSSPSIVTWTSSPSPNPLIYAPFGQFYSLLVFLQIGIAVLFLSLSALHSVYTHSVSFSFVLSLFHSPSFASSFSAIPIIIASRAFSDCLLFAYLRVAIRPHFLSFIISLYYSFSRLLLREKKGGKNRHALVERGSRALLKFRSPRDLLRIFYERIFSNSRARSEMKVKMRFFLFFKLIFERASNGQIVRGGNVVYIERVHGVRYTIRRCNSAGNYYATRTNDTSPGLRYRVSPRSKFPNNRACAFI